MSMRRLGAAVVTFVVAAVAPALFAAPAADAASYRFWSYWTVDSGSWTFAQVGPATLRPKDGAVQGWRFSVSADSASALKPRIGPGGAFDEVCGGTSAEDGKKRVALVVDFGIPSHAPSGDAPPAESLRGTCVVANDRADGWDVLVQAGYGIRSDGSGLVCALSGYPQRGCGETVKDPTPPPASGGSGSGAGNAPSTGGGSSSDRTRDDGASRGRDRSDSNTSSDRNGRDGRSTSTAGPSPSATATDAAKNRDERDDTAAEPSATAPTPGTSGEPTPTLVTGAPDTASASSDGPGGALVTLLGITAVVGIGGAAFVRSRRRA
jgi:hypothetical protein